MKIKTTKRKKHYIIVWKPIDKKKHCYYQSKTGTTLNIKQAAKFASRKIALPFIFRMEFIGYHPHKIIEI